MLQDDSGELSHVKLDPSLISSDNAIIVLDEYNDTTWVWIGRDVNMPTRMHALRMGRSVQKSGYKVGVTTIGMALDNYVEMLEKNDSDSDAIARFREVVGAKYKFDDGVLAYDESKAKEWEAESPQIVDSRDAVEPSSTPQPPPSPKPETPKTKPVEVVAETVETTPTPAAKPSAVSTGVEPEIPRADKKTAYLIYSAVKNADLVYTERFERSGKSGVKIEAPGVMMIEVIQDGDNLTIEPPDFGNTETATKIRNEYNSWIKKL